MKKILADLFGVIILFCLIKRIKSINENFTLKDYAFCKEIDVIEGYNYKTFFKIDDLKEKDANGYLINIEVGVLATRDAHIMLSEISNPENDIAVYEIVLGAGANTFCEIRRQRKKQSLQTKTIKNVLSPIKPTPLSIKITQEGRIEIKIIGQIFPLLSVTDSNPLNIKYISFSSWGTAEAKWFYDCPSEGFIYNNNNTNNLEPIPRYETPKTKLINQLRIEKLGNKQPTEFLEIKIFLEIQKADFITRESIFKSRVIFKMNWRDTRLVWSPEDFNGITELKLNNRGFWVPQLLLINGKTSYTSELDLQYKISITKDGVINCISKVIELESWCTETEVLKTWPKDQVICSLQLAVNENNLSLNSQKIDFIDNPEQIQNTDTSEWKIEFIENELITTLNNNNNNNNANLDDRSQLNLTGDLIRPTLTYQIFLERNQSFYQNAFVTPIFCSLIMIIISFWASGYFRTVITLLGTIILTISFITMSEYTPVTYVPLLMTYYIIAFYLSWFSFIFVLINLWLNEHPPIKPPHSIILSIIDNYYMRFILVLDSTNSYNEIDHNARKPWSEVSKISDRIIFIILLIFTIIIAINGY